VEVGFGVVRRLGITISRTISRLRDWEQCVVYRMVATCDPDLDGD